MTRSTLVVAALMWAAPGLAQDACPEDPDKTAPGLCGCGVEDTDWDQDGEDDSCIDANATVAADAIIGYRAFIGAGATIGAGADVLAHARVEAGANIGANATIAERAVVGALAIIGEGTVVGRRSVVGGGAEVGADSVLARAVSWGAGTTSGPRTAVGYGSTIGADGTLASDVTIGSLVTVGDRFDAGTLVVVARGAILGDDVVLGTRTVLGPQVQLGDGSTTGARARLRKECVFGLDAQIGADARVGREASFGNSARIGEGAVLRSQVSGGTFATVDGDGYVPRGTDLGDGVGLPEITGVTGPLDWVFEPEQPVMMTVQATDPQDLPLTVTWSLDGAPAGWSIDAPTAASTLIVPPAPTDGPATVTVRVVVDNGLRTTETTQQITLFSQASCWDYKDTAALAPERNRGDGLYWVSATGDVTQSSQVWCDQTTAGGGWMLVAERPGPASRQNIEDCGNTLDQFFTNGCGVPAALGAGASYAMSEAGRAQHPRTAWLFHQYDDVTPDTDDAWIAYTSTDLFAQTSDLVDRPVDRACDLSGFCDADEVIFRYHGTGWFGTSLCATSGESNPYFGNYGLCHAGASQGQSQHIYKSNALFGDRDGYDETKLWAHASGIADEFTERIFMRNKPIEPETNAPPVIASISVPTTLPAGSAATPISVSASDADGDTLTYAWNKVYGGSQWVIGNATSATATLTPPPAISGGSYVTVEVSVYDGNNHVANRVFRVDRGTHTSCQSWYDVGATTSGVYSIDPQGDGNAIDVYCEQELYGGGWTLISNRRQNSVNVEACGSRLRDFFTAGCGSVSAIGSGDSYALTATDRNRLPKTQMLQLQYSNGVLDGDDAVRIDLGSLSDPFPNSSGSVIRTPVTQICSAAGTHCDSSNTYWVYTGDNWYASSLCTATLDSGTQYKGNYGYCLNGVNESVASSGLPAGNRAGYDETKLWAHPNNAAAYQERLFYR